MFVSYIFYVAIISLREIVTESLSIQQMSAKYPTERVFDLSFIFGVINVR